MRLKTVACCCALALLWPQLAPAKSLIRIYQLAIDNDAEFAAAQAAYDAGKEAWPQARSVVLPPQSASASDSEIRREVEATPFSGGSASSGGSSSFSGPTPPFTDEFGAELWGVELRQPLFNWAIPATLSQGKDRVNVATLAFRAARDDLMARVMGAYLDFLRADAELELTLAEQKAIQADLERTNGRYEVGAISVTALREAQAALDLA
ncbi:MAG: TolC family protein, partial [Salinisphaera sp.]|nr:TolC family protein [Salinisphaera sp.]